MKHINDFNKYITESQSKKIRKFMDFSVVLRWYRENKEKIAKLIDCDPSELASEEEILTQSKGLIKDVINPQAGGNSGRNNAGFNSFKPLEMNLIHDILHNMYQVSIKNFDARLTELEFEEAEIVEELECLGIEETFMKYLNIPYVKSDFINQNINMLTSYLMITILKNDPERVASIIEGKTEPYLDVYGKHYPTKGTPFEGIFELFKTLPKDPSRPDDDEYVSNLEDLKDFIVEILYVALIIDETNGDRAEYPEGSWEGSIDYDEMEKIDEYDEYVERELVRDHLKLINNEVWKKIHGYNSRDYKDVPTITYKGDEWVVVNEDSSIEKEKLTPDQIEKYELDIDELENTEEAVSTKGYIPLTIEQQALYAINGVILTEYTDISDIKINIYEGLSGNGYTTKKIDVSRDDLSKLSFDELFDDIIKTNGALNILRRYFRTDDIVRNNTSLGTDDDHWETNRSDKKPFKQFKGEYASKNYLSISKNILTNNGKRLWAILENLRGYLIKNFQEVKAQKKSINGEFSPIVGNIKKILSGDNLEAVKKFKAVISNFHGNIDELLNPGYELIIIKNSYNRSKNPFHLELSMTPTILENSRDLILVFDEMKSVLEPVKDKEYFWEYLKNFNFDNESGGWKRDNISFNTDNLKHLWNQDYLLKIDQLRHAVINYSKALEEFEKVGSKRIFKCLVSFFRGETNDQLVNNTEAEFKKLSDRLKIEFQKLSLFKHLESVNVRYSDYKIAKDSSYLKRETIFSILNIINDIVIIYKK